MDDPTSTAPQSRKANGIAGAMIQATAEPKAGQGVPISDDAPYNRREAMQLLKLKSATFSKLVNGKLKGLPPLIPYRVGRLQFFRGATLRQWLIDAEAMACNVAH
jgi:hypothetical protein